MKADSVSLVAIGAYLPNQILTNADLEKLVETSDEWIVTRTGISQRHIASSSQAASDMGVLAARAALEKAKINPESIDLILCATTTGDHLFPSTACLIQAGLGAVHAAAFDIQAACSGAIYGFILAKALIESGTNQRVLLVTTEKMSSLVDYTDRNTCILFGDGAAAFVLMRSNEAGFALQESVWGSDGSQAMHLQIPAGGSRQPTTEETVANKAHNIQMNGSEIFKMAVKRMQESIEGCLHRAQLCPKKVRWLIPHQANERIIKAVGKNCAIPPDRVFSCVEWHGNTSSASLGLALDALLQRHPIEKGDQLLLTAFGAGMTWGAILLRANEPSKGALCKKE